MYENGEDHFYYLTVCNENYVQPPMPEVADIREGILRGLYLYQASPRSGPAQVTLFGSGSDPERSSEGAEDSGREVRRRSRRLERDQLHRTAPGCLDVDRWNRLHPGRAAAQALSTRSPGRRRYADHRGH